MMLVCSDVGVVTLCAWVCGIHAVTHYRDQQSRGVSTVAHADCTNPLHGWWLDTGWFCKYLPQWDITLWLLSCRVDQ